MAGDYLRLVSGIIKEIAAIVTSAGAGDAGKIPKLDAGGKLDNSLMPSGLGADTALIACTEDLSAGDFVNVYNSSGVKCRKADADALAKRAHGFVLAAVTSGQDATVYFSGLNNQLSGMTVGAEQYLSQTAGARTETPPTGASVISQRLGVAHSATELYFTGAEVVVEQIA